MLDQSENPEHPGRFIKQHVIPTGMSVKQAAERLGVGRPALSNLLNGNSSLSPDMALRLEKAFGGDRLKLLDLQAAFERRDRRGDDKVIAVRAYVPAFLTIKARQIHGWPDGNLEARYLLSVLLRKLVNSTGDELRQVDFPGYDNAEREGWDGFIEAGTATPWIPEGKSGWEFGVDQRPGRKAESDYAARLSLPLLERARCTFVFVTPRNWAGKSDWVKSKNACGDWKSVRALDASDLEQWLEASIPAQIWFAEKLGMPVSGFETLEQCWQRWAAASDPQLTPMIFKPSIIAYTTILQAWLEKRPERPFIVAADSKHEALAFIACIFQHNEINLRSKDLAAVFESAETLRILASALTPFLPIVCTEEAERELATVYRRFHCIVVRPRNSIDSEPDIALDLLGHDAFEKALADMGLEGDNVERLARESGNSPTILRRRLSKIDAIKTPHWAKNAEIARDLIPIVLLGVWHAKSNADCEVIRSLADRDYHEIEVSVTRLLPYDDCPVWSVGSYRGIASKIDALFAVSRMITERDLTEFFLIAEYVLSEIDPALTLSEDQRWAAGLYGKLRDHSAALRRGICETLVILSVHGNNLFRNRIGIDVESLVSSLIRRLLTPLTPDKLLSHVNDLPNYAEAAPDKFLRLMEHDLQQSEPVALALLKPSDIGAFGGCPRSGLLWALECLAWQRLGRVTAILAQLSQTVINDNWANKPIASLSAIYSCWIPQTAASLAERKKALETLIKRFPDIGWQICIEQFEIGSRAGRYNYRPRWRSDASGAGQSVATEEMYEFMGKALALALAWPRHDQKTLGDLVERLQGMPENERAAVWDKIDLWTNAETDDLAKAELRERIRRFALTRRGRLRHLDDVTKDQARAAYAKLEVRDSVVRHAWLFTKQWVEESADENFDLHKRDERLHRMRRAAMKEIWVDRGFEGAMALLSASEAPWIIGRYLALCVRGTRNLIKFLRECLFAVDYSKNKSLSARFARRLKSLRASAA